MLVKYLPTQDIPMHLSSFINSVAALVRGRESGGGSGGVAGGRAAGGALRARLCQQVVERVSGSRFSNDLLIW